LRAVEDNQYSKIPGEVFVKGILRTYGNYLGLDGTKLIEQYKIYAQGLAPEQAAIPKIREATHVTITPTFKPNEDTPKNQKNSLLLILVAVVVDITCCGCLLFFVYGETCGTTKCACFKNCAKSPDSACSKNIRFSLRKQMLLSNKLFNRMQLFPRMHLSLSKHQIPKHPATTGKVNVDITCKGICWLQVYDNNKLVYEGTMGKDEKMHFASDTALRVVYGNIRDVQVNVNGKAEPAMDTNDVVTKDYGQSDQKGI
jgi:cytoskeleton protein RodZ